MSQQINLYEARLRPSRDRLTACNLGVGVLVLLAMMTGWAVWVGVSASRSAEAAALVRKEVSEEQEKLVALTRSLAGRQVSPVLATELERTKITLAMRSEALRILDSGRLGKDAGFSAFLVGFARQAQTDLWLTGFQIAAGGEDIEIRGRMLSPSRLPGYVQHLSEESIFQGRRFATLDMQDVEPEAQAKSGTAVKSGEAPRLPRFVEFTLRSERIAPDDMKKTSQGGRE